MISKIAGEQKKRLFSALIAHRISLSEHCFDRRCFPLSSALSIISSRPSSLAPLPLTKPRPNTIMLPYQTMLLLAVALISYLLVLSALAETTITLDTKTTGTRTADPQQDELSHFLTACAEGHLEDLEIILEEHPEFITRTSEHGESCLHVAAMRGQTAITQAALKAGANPNQRSTYDKGLRMTPLSWNVYGGHADTVRALLEGGADVNLDFDSMMDPEQSVTALDVLEAFVLNLDKPDALGNNKNDPNDKHYGKYHKVREVLLEYGAKRYNDLGEATVSDGGETEL